MVLMNAHGRVAEATGACILMARSGEVTTPPPYEGALESITVDAAESICAGEHGFRERAPRLGAVRTDAADHGGRVHYPSGWVRANSSVTAVPGVRSWSRDRNTVRSATPADLNSAQTLRPGRPHRLSS